MLQLHLETLELGDKPTLSKNSFLKKCKRISYQSRRLMAYSININCSFPNTSLSSHSFNLVHKVGH